MRVSFEIFILLYLFIFFFSICYYYYRYCFIASRRWFLTYIYSNFENTFFGLSNLEFFTEFLYALIYVYSFYSFLFFLSISLFFLSFFLFFKFNLLFYYYYYNYLYLCILYVYRPCWKTYKISSRFESCFVFAFQKFFILEIF